MNNNRYEIGQHIFSVLIATGSLFCYFILASEWSSEETLRNIVIYVIGLFVFAIFFFVSELLIQYLNIEISDQFLLGVAVLLTAFLFVWSIGAYYIETVGTSTDAVRYIRHNIAPWVYGLVVVVMSIMCMHYVRMFSETRKVCMLLRGIWVITLAVIESYMLYAPNPFQDFAGHMYHIDAYTTSIINDLKFVPYSEETTGIYGHYGIFFIIPVKILKLFGVNEWIAITLLLATVGFITFLIQNYLLAKLIKNDILFFIATLAVASAIFQVYGGPYYQGSPHRIVFPSIILLGCYCTIKKIFGKIFTAFMWVMCTLAIVWNIDVGIVASLVWTLCRAYARALDKRKWKFSNIVIYTGGYICTYLAAYVTVNLYNIVCGGSWISFEVFNYPIGSGSYHISELQYPIKLPIDGYFFVIVLFAAIICYYTVSIFKINIQDSDLIMVLSSIMGLGCYANYINRTDMYHGAIICFEVVLCSACICDKAWGFDLWSQFNWKKYKEVGFLQMPVTFIYVVLIAMALSSIGGVGTSLAQKVRYENKQQRMDDFTNVVKSTLPENTLAFGEGVPQIFAYINSKPSIYLSDWPDVTPEALESLQKLLTENQYDTLFVCCKQEEYVPENYVKSDTYYYNDEYQYFRYDRVE